ncbi:sentrin-specific protease 6 isoform X4 [Strongylocentrotus purpuratus]|uniref:Ubiquitin-like protease family profile domain-containing protein n=1 Tax=Strongylocentrotus purpuratus TaxID=7668 RepID=A0A7M7PGH8_STRPU|nr:sentrin-specific protease 6 isoform X4 [Strongylocentrotus purpuratus]
MSSKTHSNSLLAALTEVDLRNPSLGFSQSFTVFNQQSSSPAVSNSSTRASSSTDGSSSEEVQVISSNTSDSSTSSAPQLHLVLSPQHRDPQTYDRKDTKAIPKKGASPGNQSAPGFSQNPWNVKKHEVKLSILKAGGDRISSSNSSAQLPVQEHTISMVTVPHTTPMVTVPHTTAGTANATSNVATHLSQSCSNTASSCSTAIQIGNNSAVSSTKSMVAQSSGLEDTTQRMEVGATESTKEENLNAAKPEKEESSETNDSSEPSSPPKEPMEALCSNCGAWSGTDQYCSFCNVDFASNKPKKTRPRTTQFFPTPRPTYRKEDAKGYRKSIRLPEPAKDLLSKLNAATGTTSHGTSTVSNTSTGNTQSGNAQSDLIRVKSLAQPGICLKPHPTNKQRFIVVNSVPTTTNAPSTTTTGHSIDAKTFYVNRIAAVSSAPAASMGGITKMVALTKDAKDNSIPKSRKRNLKSGGGRKTPAKRVPPKRKEPEIVLISDSEDEEEESAKQKSTDAAATEDATEADEEELARSFMTVKAKMRDQKGNLMGRPDTHGGNDSTDGHHPQQSDPNCLRVAFNVSILRFGSWPMHTIGTRLKLPAVSMTPDGFHFHFQQLTHKCGKIELLIKDIEKCDHYLSDNGYPTFFITTTPRFAGEVRSWLAMNRKEAHFDPGSKEEYEKMVVIRSADERNLHSYKEQVQKVLAAMAEKSNNSGSGLKFEPIDNTRTGALLDSSTRPEMKGAVFITRPNNGSHAPTTLNSTDRPVSITMQQLAMLKSGQGGAALTRDTKTRASLDDQSDNKLFVYPPPPKFGGITVTTEDRDCLEEGEFLNDVIIDFYLKYIVMEKLSDVDRERTHLFSCFFYKRLLQKDTPGNISPDLNGLTPKEKRHQKVRKWTRHVDIFAKDFIIIPINDCAHWFVAIICFAGEVIHMKKGSGKSPSQSPSPSSSNQPSPASAASPATPSPAAPSRATPSPSDQSVNHSSPGIQPSKSSDQPANHRTPGVQLSSSSPQQSINPHLEAELPSKSPSGQTAQTMHDSSESANRMAEAAHVCQQPATQGSDSTREEEEEEPMDTSESPDERVDKHESERTAQELKNTENNPSNNPLNKSLGNSTETLSASNNTAASEKVIPESAISSSQADPRSLSSPATIQSHPSPATVQSHPSPLTVQSPAVNGGASGGRLLDFDYQQYHVGEHKHFKQPCILVFDSLAGPPRRNVIAKLRDYLTIEWEKRKEGKCEFTTANMKGMNPKIPQQNNFSDCGLYVCQYVETFFEKPIRNYHSPMRGLQSWFRAEVVAKKRQETRDAIQQLHEAYKARR